MMAFKEAARVSFNRYPNHDDSGQSDDLSESESYEDTDNSSPNRSYDPEWVDDVTESGELFFVGTSLPIDHQLADAPAQEEIKAATDSGISKTKSETKRTGRLKALVKSNKVIKNGNLGPREVPGAEDTASIQMISRVSLEEPKGDLIEVIMDVDPKRHNYGRRATACEILFGIIPGYFENGKISIKNGSSQNLDAAQDDKRIIVRGLIPDGEAMRSDKIKIGDWLRYVNDIEVSFSNIQQILNSIYSPAKLKVTFERLPIPAVKDDSLTRNGYKTKLAKLISRTNDDEEKESMLQLNAPHIVLYLAADRMSEQGTGKEDILYCFPRVDNKLVQIRGLYITIGHTMADVSNSSPVSSTIKVDGMLCYLAYIYEGKELLIIGMPQENIDLLHLHHLVEDITRLLRLQYLSLHKAFSPPENASALDHMFTVIFQQLLTKQGSINSSLIKNNFGSFQDNELAAHWLPLPPDTDIEIQNLMGEFESAEFLDLSDDYYDARRSYSILGACLFYRSLILANHLPTEDMLDMYSFVKYYGLLALTYSESISRVIIWKEVFPTRRRDQTLDKDYPEVTGRYFLLIIGLKQYLFGTLLETGGYSAKAEGNPGPDPCLINQAEALLLQLESMQLSSVCESWMNSNIPALANVDWFTQPGKSGKDDSPFRTRDPSPSVNPQATRLGAPNLRMSQTELTTVLKKKSNSRYLTGSSLALHDNESDTSPSMGTSVTSSLSDENVALMPQRDQWLQGRTSSSDAESRGSSNNALYKNEKKSRLFPSGSSLDIGTLEKSSQEQENLPIRLTTGPANILFHYLQLDTADGVFIAPAEIASSSMLNTELTDNFQNACVLIHNVFQDTIKQMEMTKKKEVPQFSKTCPFGHVKEHGILFQCSLPARPNQKKPSPTVSYWVVGRLFWTSSPHEVYVCFLDSVPQNMIELAFTLGFGIQF